MESVRLARAHGCRLVGATAHRVTADLDAGPILAQACVVDKPKQSKSALYDAVFRCGGVALAAAVDGLFDSSAGQAGGALRAGELPIFAAPIPRSEVCDVFRNDAYWESLR
jgi:folate-dependent phosphoribosylglycinamide formyltransferase PurN